MTKRQMEKRLIEIGKELLLENGGRLTDVQLAEAAIRRAEQEMPREMEAFTKRVAINRITAMVEREHRLNPEADTATVAASVTQKLKWWLQMKKARRGAKACIPATKPKA